jgi:hypothetical protein
MVASLLLLCPVAMRGLLLPGAVAVGPHLLSRPAPVRLFLLPRPVEVGLLLLPRPVQIPRLLLLGPVLSVGGRLPGRPSDYPSHQRRHETEKYHRSLHCHPSFPAPQVLP